MSRCRVQSWSLYELVNEASALLRAWCPNDIDMFEAVLVDVFGRRPGMIAEKFIATDTLVHWLWSRDATEQLPSPDNTALDQRLAVTATERSLEAEDRSSLIAQRLFARGPQRHGIEFVVVIGPSRYPTAVINREHYLLRFAKF